MFEIMKPFYYDMFSCTAGECKASCCRLGWKIGIDSDTYQVYQKMEGHLGEKLRNNTSENFPHFFTQKDGKCPFYTENRLCELHAENRTELQSETCRNYPRFATSYNDFFDLSLALSCPEIAKTLIHCTEPITFIEESFDDDQNTEFLSKEVLDTFRAVRKRCIEMLQNRKEPLWQRTYYASVLSFSLYQWYKNGVSESFSEVIECNDSILKRDIVNRKTCLDQLFLLLECIDHIPVLTKLLDPSFDEMKMVLTNPEFYNHYEEIHEEFNTYYKEFMYLYENYLVYYINQNFLIGLLQENQSLDKETAFMAVTCALLKSCAETVWYQNNREITMDKQVDIMYTFARIFEHGIVLKETLYKCMCKLHLCEPETLADLLRTIL